MMLSWTYCTRLLIWLLSLLDWPERIRNVAALQSWFKLRRMLMVFKAGMSASSHPVHVVILISQLGILI